MRLFSLMNVFTIFGMMVALLALSPGATRAGVEDQLGRDLFQIASPDEPYCVPNLLNQFDNFKHHGEALGFHIGSSPDPTIGKHYQGIQRAVGEGRPYAFVSRNGNATIGDPIGNDPGNLLIVRFDSRDTNGEHLRSNKLQTGVETPDTVPPGGDAVVHTITFDGGQWPDYRHAGGMQTFGDVLAVALENQGDSASAEGMISFIDMSNPESPVNLNEIELDHTAGAVALARHPSSGNILMIVEGPQSNEKLLVYESNVPDIRDPNLAFELVDEWQDEELAGGEWPTGATAHQSINLLADCNGELYLLGTRNTNALPSLGEDRAVVYQVGLDANDDLSLTQVRNGHFFCNSASGLICNFVAAAAFYVSPGGELILYGTEHENDGPGGTVRMGEFRHRDTFRPNSPAWAPSANANGPYEVDEGGSVTLDGSGSQPPIAQAWAEFYDDASFLDRSVVMDFSDRNLDDFNNFNDLDDALNDLEDGFNDKTSSVRWAAPVGCSIILYEDDNYGGETLELVGTGEVESISNLDDHDFGDRASSAAFSGTSCSADATTHDWDLMAAPGFETPGVNPLFDAAQIDGPASVAVTLQVCGAFYSLCDVSETIVTVNNVAPAFTAILDFTGIDEGDQVVVSGTITDPAPADTFTLTIDWGDGSDPTVLALPAGSTSYQASHTYADDFPQGTPSDIFDIDVSISDDDGGEDDTFLQVTVNNLAPVIDSVTSDGPVVTGSTATITVDASDAGGAFDPLTYQFDCDNDGGYDVGPQDMPTTTCDFGIQEGAFLVNVRVADDDAGSATGSVVVEVPTFFCLNRVSGATRYVDVPEDCGRYEVLVTLSQSQPVTVCTHRMTGVMRVAMASDCSRYELATALPEEGPLAVCVDRLSGQLHSGTPGIPCARTSFPRLIGTPLP